MTKKITDPRSELKNDSELWTKLLQLAEYDFDLTSTLCFFRYMGTRIWKRGNGYVLRPEIDPTGENSWPNQKYYKKMCDEKLKPYTKLLEELLEEVNKGVNGM